MKNILARTLLALPAFIPALGSSVNADQIQSYEMDFGKLRGCRQEVVYKTAGNIRQAIQTRVYCDAKKTDLVTESGFLQKDGSWRIYGDTNIPKVLEAEIERTNLRVSKRNHVPTLDASAAQDHSKDKPYKPSDVGSPVSVNPLNHSSSFSDCIRNADGQSIVCSDGIFVKQNSAAISRQMYKIVGELPVQTTSSSSTEAGSANP
jgi:hypothetical protein